MDNKFCKFYKWQKYASYDGGKTWQPLDEYIAGDLYETLSVDCGVYAISYRWVLIDEYECTEVQDKYVYYYSNGDGIVTSCDEDGIFKSVSIESVQVNECAEIVPNDFARAMYGLKDVVIESGITSIGDAAFGECYSLSGVNISDTIKTIGEWSFGYCSELSSITLSQDLEFIKKAAFIDCKSLTSVVIPSNCKQIGYIVGDEKRMNDGVPSKYEGVFSGCINLSSVTLNEGLEIIGARTFNNCVNLTSFEAPSTLKILGFNAAKYIVTNSSSPTWQSVTAQIGVFVGCKSLSSVTLNEGLEVIGNNAFLGCTSLSSITIPSTVTNMYMSCFRDCSSLEYVISLPTVPPQIGTADENQAHATPFYNTNNCPIYVPDESVNAYKNASIWSEYERRIKPLSTFNN